MTTLEKWYEGAVAWVLAEVLSPEKEDSFGWFNVIIMIFTLTISFIFSALNLGIMGLEVNELEMLMNSGTPQEQRYARAVLPVRKNGNFLLCSILLVLTLFNAVFTTMLDNMFSSLVAVVCTTIMLVLFGEILPQSLGCRHGLALSAKTIYLIRLAMLITFPISYPLGKILDLVLGNEVQSLRNRENLKALVRAAQSQVELNQSEVNIIAGTLEMASVKVESVMTPLIDCYMLDIEKVLGYDVIAEIVAQGYSRVPIFEGSRTNVVSILFTKDLALVDPADALPIRDFLAPHRIYKVPEGTTLNVVLSMFKTGVRGHMAFVTRPAYSGRIVIGLVTLEDVLEEILKSEIHDEADLYRRSPNVANTDQRLIHSLSTITLTEK